MERHYMDTHAFINAHEIAPLKTVIVKQSLPL